MKQNSIKLHIGAPVLVEWGDAWVDNPLTFVTEEEGAEASCLLVREVGFLLSSTSEGISLNRSVDVNNKHRGWSFIPRGCIKSIKELK